jgi:cysteinyl-tRNA synthetase
MKLFNSLTGKKEIFEPLDLESKIRMYVCGPTVYDRPHIGNARAVVVYDILYRVLKEIYGEENVVYARNITDVDDKINKAAKQRKVSIQDLTKEITDLFHSDMLALNNLKPDFEPKATENMAEIISMIEKIIANGKAYVAKGHVLLDVNSIENNDEYHYGVLSGKKMEDLIAGARVKVEDYKRDPRDFVLWKPSDDEDDESSKFDSPWGVGRPGWHIECSAMSTNILGENFDIHGGGADLKFPHHENEIAQSCCANPESKYAKYWVHNGFVTVNGEKMSKSLGNFTTVKDLLDKGINGEIIRFALLSSHYRKPLDFSDKLLEDSRKSLNKLYDAIKIWDKNQQNPKDKNQQDISVSKALEKRNEEAYKNLKDAIYDDMNVPLALSHLYILAKSLRSYDCTNKAKEYFDKAIDILGVCQMSLKDWQNANKNHNNVNDGDIDETEIERMISERSEAKTNKNWVKADQIRDELKAKGINLIDTADGTKWEAN